MATVYWVIWAVALASGAFYLSVAIRQYRLPSQFDVDQCAKCGYPKAPAASQCPECGQSYAVRGAPKHAQRAILIGLLLVAFPISFAFTLRQYVGNLERCLPNNILFVLAEHFSSEPALEELDERIVAGHARLPAWLAPPPGQRAYARLCARILGPPLPRHDEAVLAYKGLCVSVTDDQAVVETLDNFLDSESAEVRKSMVALLEAMHASAPTRWEAVVTAERRKQLLEDPSLDVRLCSARMFWASDNEPRATVVFEEALQTKRGRELVLFQFNYPTTLHNLDSRLGPGIAKALHGSPYQDQGLWALQNLTSISDETLHELVQVEWEDNAAMASYHGVLVKAGPRAVIELDRLCERLDHDNPQVSGTAALALGAIGAGAAEAIPRLERMVRDGHPYFGKHWALTALEQIASDAALPLALDELEKIANERETTMALLWMQDAALEIVAKHARPGDKRACEAVQRVLARAESQRVRDKIQAVLDQLCQ